MKIEEFGMANKYITGMVAGAALCEVDYYIQDAAMSTGLSSSIYGKSRNINEKLILTNENNS